jgi:beta-phosphoglucomutase-like phosphatase (HAD superfamily)
MEVDAALTAAPTSGFRQLLLACADSGRDVGVISTLDESAILAALRAHGLDPFVKAVAGRRGPDLSTVEAGWAADQAAALLGVPLGSCLYVSGWDARLRSARWAGAVCLGYECGRDSRKHLSGEGIPVVSHLQLLTLALRAG